MSQPKNAEDRLIQKIYSYPGTGNNTQFSYDQMDRCVQIQENGSTPGYSGSAIKNFIWCGSERCEQRDNSNAVVSQYSGLGQRNSTTNYFYAFDHLGSVREVTNDGGTVQGAFGFDPYGNMTVLSGSFTPDFGFTGIYQHSRTNLDLTWFRQYNPALGRWLSRDPLGENAGLNLYGYAGNNPSGGIDPLGLGTITEYTNPGFNPYHAYANYYAQNTAKWWITRHDEESLTLGFYMGMGVLGGQLAVGGAIAGGGNYVYRGLAEGEEIGGGLSARCPNAGNSPMSHVAGKKDSQWISTTKSKDIAINRFGKHGVVQIDLSKVSSEIIDISNGQPFGQNARMLNSWAKNAQEVLIQNSVPSDALLRLK